MAAPELNNDPLQPQVVHIPPARPSLKEKLSKVAEHCAYIQKDGVNTHFNYNYAMASDVFARVNEALIANRLVSSTWFDIESRDGGMVTVRCRLEIHDLDSDQSISWNGYGSGQDKGDKAVMKAQTAALKYAWIMGLNISTGDDPEADARTDAEASGEPVRAKQTPEGYAAKVERNKTAKLSPLAVELSNKLNAELAKEGVPVKTGITQGPDGRWFGPDGKVIKEAGGLWPEPATDLPPVEAYEPEAESSDTCACGSPLITKMVKGKKDPEPMPKLFCELADLAGNYEWAVSKGKDPRKGAREAFQMIQKLDKSGEFPADAHTKFKPKP